MLYHAGDLEDNSTILLQITPLHFHRGWKVPQPADQTNCDTQTIYSKVNYPFQKYAGFLHFFALYFCTKVRKTDIQHSTPGILNSHQFIPNTSVLKLERNSLHVRNWRRCSFSGIQGVLENPGRILSGELASHRKQTVETGLGCG